jgi:hypothetical protein
MTKTREIGDIIGTYSMKSGEGLAYEGMLLKVDSDGASLTKTTAKGDSVYAVGYDATKDRDGNVVTGGKVDLLQEGEANVAIVASQSFNVDSPVYVDNTEPGMGTADAQTSGATIVGYSAEKKTTSATKGDLLKTRLALNGNKIKS